MNVWTWVGEVNRDLRANGHERLARQVWGLAHNAVEGHHDRVDADVAEIVSQAAALRLPWLEIFARHWQLQSREDGARALPAAVELFERAHRADTRDCPQSVCVTQDLAIAYGATDGPGYANERAEVARETLARIDATWNCYQCLTVEWAAAVAEGGDPDAAVRIIEEQIEAARAAGAPVADSFHRRLAIRLNDAGRPADALAALDRVGPPDAGDGAAEEVEYRLTRVDALIRLGRADEAAALLPAPDEITKLQRNHRDWVVVAHRLVAAGVLDNNARLGAVLHGFLRHLVGVGSYRRGFEVGAVHAELALARGAGWVVAEALDTMRGLQADLVIDAGAAATLADLTGRLAEHEAAVAGDPELPVPADELIAHLRSLGDDLDIERALEWLRRAAAQRPDDSELTMTLAGFLDGLGRTERAQEVLRAVLARRPDDEQIAGMLGELVLAHGDDEALAGLTAQIEGDHLTLALWLRARSAFADGRWEDCRTCCREIVAREPDALNTRRLWADAARRLGDFDEAVELRLEVVEREDEAGNDDWEAMVDASAAGRWDVVRRCSARLGHDLPEGDGPIDQVWERVLIRYESDGGQDQTVVADRTGPATARVVSIAPDNAPQRVGDLVVFRPQPLEPPPDDEQARADFIATYRVVTVLETGRFAAYTIDGVHPGPDALADLRAALAGRGGTMWIYSDDSYRVTTPAGDEVPGLYARIATPADVPAVDVDRLLTAVVRQWEHPLAWPELAQAVGADWNRHRSIITRYGL